MELRDGESLAIGGLFQHGCNNDVSQIPGLGDIPILSSLFRSDPLDQRNETELLIIVTPHIITARRHRPGQDAHPLRRSSPAPRTCW